MSDTIVPLFKPNPIPTPRMQATTAWLDKYAPNKMEHFNSHPTIPMPPNEGLQGTSLLFQIANACYDHHYNFTISPEVLWYCVSNAVAEAVKSNPTKYGSIFSHSPDKKILVEVSVPDYIYGQPNDWTSGIAMFEGAMAPLIPSDILTTMVPHFSGSTPIDNVTHLISFMDAASPYYNYRMNTLCGFPQIGISGTVDDWNKFLAGLSSLGEHIDILKDYTDVLIDIVTQIRDTVRDGSLNTHFWNNMYKRDNGSGGPYINGWLSSFVAYQYYRNVAHLRTEDQIRRGHITTADLPSHVSTVNFTWNYFGKMIPMLWQAGVIGVEFVDGFWKPCLGFRVLEVP